MGGGVGGGRNKIFQNIVCRIFYPACGASKALQIITEPVTIFTLNNRQKSLSKQCRGHHLRRSVCFPVH